MDIGGVGVCVKITVNDNFIATKNFKLLGRLGETNARMIEITHPEVEGADTYRLRFEYKNAVYDVPIVDGKVKITASLLCEVGQIKCQWIATKSDSDNYTLVAKSQIFELKIGDSISDDVAPIPPYELSKSISDKVLEAESSAKEYAAQTEKYKYETMSFKDVAKEQAGIAKTATAQAQAYAEISLSAAQTATQKADELTALLDSLNTALELCLNGGAVDG